MLDPSEFMLSHHFVNRALDMQLTPERIEDCLRNPDRKVPSVNYPGATLYDKGDITFAVNDAASPREVITALWSSQEAWERDLSEGGYGGRQLRDYFGGKKVSA